MENDRPVENVTHANIETSLVLCAEILRLVHEARVDRGVALSAIRAAEQHVHCVPLGDTL
jgi:hypothetical protein